MAEVGVLNVMDYTAWAFMHKHRSLSVCHEIVIILKFFLFSETGSKEQASAFGEVLMMVMIILNVSIFYFHHHPLLEILFLHFLLHF